MKGVRSFLSVLGALALVPMMAATVGAQDPNHGSGDVACGTVKKGIYTVSQRGATKAVTVEIIADAGCRAVILQDGILNTRDVIPPMAQECASTTSSTTASCLGAKNLSIACEGSGAGSCSYRITQIDQPGPVSGMFK
jgi:hypothetical protein